jgi:hypothetical protein
MRTKITFTVSTSLHCVQLWQNGNFNLPFLFRKHPDWPYKISLRNKHDTKTAGNQSSYSIAANDYVFKLLHSFVSNQFKRQFDIAISNVVVERSTHLLRIREVQLSNLVPETGYPDLGFSWFSSVPPGKCWDSSLKLGHGRLVLNLFQFIIHLSPFHWTL